MLFVLTGPESSGKTTLTEALARHFDVPSVSEAARRYLKSPHYNASDLLAIARAQGAAERTVTSTVTFADTDLQTIYIWWQEKYGPAPLSLTRAYARQTPRHYLLCAPDLAWAPDPLRENPLDRDRLFDLYQADLDRRGLTYDTITGLADERFHRALKAVEAVLTA